jgi:hypothetical protein
VKSGSLAGSQADPAIVAIKKIADLPFSRQVHSPVMAECRKSIGTVSATLRLFADPRVP